MKVISKEKMMVVGLTVVAPFDELHKQVPKAWNDLENRLDEITHRKDNVMTEISMHVEDGVYTELLGVRAETEATVPEGMSRVHIPGQRYIYHHHTGSLEEIARSFGKMYDWADKNGFEAGDFKIDTGYQRDGSVRPHDLYVKIME